MVLIGKIISDPLNSKNYKELVENWKSLLKTDSGKDGNQNSAIINRIFAACTTDVSSTVTPKMFNQVYEWFVNEGLIKSNEETSKNWFTKNQNLMRQLKKVFEAELSDVGNDDFDEYWLSMFVWYLYEEIVNPFSVKKQVIKYGAPGTGKTYSVKQQTKLFFAVWIDEFAPNSSFTYEQNMELVQFHPSFTYEDFIEGLRPDLNGNLSLQNGVFKSFCQRAAQWEIDYYNLENKPNYDGKEIAFEHLTIGKIKELNLSGKHWEHIRNSNDKDDDKKVIDAIPPFFFIIDEINRAELSRVFGELMYCLEYRGVSGCVNTQYSNLNNDQTGMIKVGEQHRFFIPNNVYVMGTMNTIDRSVESFDFALRRRFRWEAVPPDVTVLKNNLPKKWTDLASYLEKLNNVIAKEPILGPDYQIGHAYLMDMKYSKELSLTDVRDLIWDDSILPLLEEYLRGTGKSDLIKSLKKAFF